MAGYAEQTQRRLVKEADIGTTEWTGSTAYRVWKLRFDLADLSPLARPALQLPRLDLGLTADQAHCASFS